MKLKLAKLWRAVRHRWWMVFCVHHRDGVIGFHDWGMTYGPEGTQVNICSACRCVRARKMTLRPDDGGRVFKFSRWRLLRNGDGSLTYWHGRYEPSGSPFVHGPKDWPLGHPKNEDPQADEAAQVNRRNWGKVMRGLRRAKMVPA